MSEYQGWTNYETWNVALWIDNDQGVYEMMKEWAAAACLYPSICLCRIA